MVLVFDLGFQGFGHGSLNLSLCMFYPPDLTPRVPTSHLVPEPGYAAYP
jgi:hypothetical protein